MLGKSVALLSLILVLATASKANHIDKGMSGLGYYDSYFADCEAARPPFQNGADWCIAYIVGKGAVVTFYDEEKRPPHTNSSKYQPRFKQARRFA